MVGASFKLLGKGLAQQVFGFASNPVCGLFIGILATSLVQSSSTTTSIVVGLVAVKVGMWLAERWVTVCVADARAQKNRADRVIGPAPYRTSVTASRTSAVSGRKLLASPDQSQTMPTSDQSECRPEGPNGALKHSTRASVGPKGRTER